MNERPARIKTKWWTPMELRKQVWCRFVHQRHRCHPEVWDRGLDGPWHCRLCHPCGEELDALMRGLKHKP